MPPSCLHCTGRASGLAIHQTRPFLRGVFGSAGVLTRPAWCSETRHGRVLGHHQLSQVSSTHSLGSRAGALHSFMWAFGILRSRTFAPLDGDAIALVPGMDLANHSSRPRDALAQWTFKNKGLFGSAAGVSLQVLCPPLPPHSLRQNPLFGTPSPPPHGQQSARSTGSQPHGSRALTPPPF
jgi:hypothetical protein